MSHSFSSLPPDIQQKIALQRFELEFQAADTYFDPHSGLKAISLDAWEFFVTPEIPHPEPLPKDLEALQALFPSVVVNPAPALQLLLETRAVDLIEINCVFKGSPFEAPYPGETTMLLLEDLVKRLPPGSFRFLGPDRQPLDPDRLHFDWQDRTIASFWPAFKPALTAMLYMQQFLDFVTHDFTDTESEPRHSEGSETEQVDDVQASMGI